MPNKFVKAMMFLSTYAVPFIVLGAVHSEASIYLRCASIGIGMIAPLVLMTYWKAMKQLSPFEVQFVHVERIRVEFLQVGLLYGFISFLIVDLADIRDLIALLVLLALLGVICIHTGMYFMNPILSLMGYRFYNVRSTNGNAYMLITKRSFLPSEQSYEVIPLEHDVLLEKQH